jgi:hypothetical protein
MDLFNIFNKKQLTQLQAQLDQVQANQATLKGRLRQQQRRLMASYTMPARGVTSISKQRALSEMTDRDPLKTQFLDSGITKGWRTLFQTTIARRVLSIKPQYALKEPPVIGDFNQSGEMLTDTPFTEAVNNLMQSSRGMSTVSPSLFDGNFSILEAIQEADIQSYGTHGGLYMVFNDDYTTNTSIESGERKLLGLQALDEACLTFDGPSDGTFNIDTYDITIEGQTLNNVDYSRVVKITDGGGFYHTPRLTDIETEILNANDLGLSLMASIAISRPKIGTSVDPEGMNDFLHFGSDEGSGDPQTNLLKVIRDALVNVMRGDDDVIVTLSSNLPDFIQPTLIETAAAFLATMQSISTKKSIPARLLMGSELGELASTQDRANFQEVVNQYRANHLTKIFRDVISRLINAGVVPRPSNPDGVFSVFWLEDKTELTTNGLVNLEKINNLLTGPFNDNIKNNLTNLAENITAGLL